VDDVELSVSAGERIALVGPNGSGKSTLALLLVGLLRPDGGTVRLQGADPSRLGPADLAHRASYVFQDPERQFLAQTVEAEILLGLRPDEQASARELLDRLGLPLERFGARSPYRLSGGEQRRLSLACALVREPSVLVLDEPTFGQDRHGYEGLLGILGEHLSAGAALIAATHDQRFIADATERTIAMDAGRIVADDRRGAPDR
jgi:energy-coupling factor transport system ATP-binding protein